MENNTEFSVRPEAELRLDPAAAIQSPPHHYRTIVLMRDVEELGIAEVAVLTDRTQEATKAIRRARLLIREYLNV